MKFKKILDNFSFSDMKRRRFVDTAIAGLTLTTILGCQSKEGQLKGKWQVVRDDGEDSGTFVEFFSDGTRLESIPRFNISGVDNYKILEGDRLSLQSRETGSTKIYSFRFDRDYLILKPSDSDREIKYKRI